MSRLHDMKKGIGVRFHTSQKEEMRDQGNAALYKKRLCHCPQCGKNFESVGELIDHQDVMQCGIIPL